MVVAEDSQMSVQKKGALPAGLQECFDNVQGVNIYRYNLLCAKLQERPLDLLIKIKPKLNDKQPESASLVNDLYQVAAHAESFTRQRPRSNKNWGHLADALDREGSFAQHTVLPCGLTSRRGHSMEHIRFDSSRHRY